MYAAERGGKGTNMLKLLTVFAMALALAYVSERNTQACAASGRQYSTGKDWAYVLLVIVMTLFAGLRTSYNDTWNYVSGFRSFPILSEFLADPENLNPFKNPLFYLFESFLKTYVDNAQVMIFTTSLFAQICFIRFFKRYSENFVFSIFIYFTLGTFVFTLAAIKQVTAMAIITLAFPYLEKRKYGRYYLLVLAAMLVHTYALAFVILPFFSTRPWRAFTFVFIAAIAVLMMNFEEVITEFMEQANELGKTIAEYEVFGDATINVFRLGVYAVPPLISLICQKWVLRGNSRTENILVHMTIISLAFMSMGTQSGANMFGRMANYFELGTICYLPTMLKKTFDERSYLLVSNIACVCFMGFFVYANGINLYFDQAYQATSLMKFISSLF